MKRKIRKFGGGGTMGASDRGYQGGGRDSKGSVSGSAPGAGGSTNTGGGGNKTTKTYKGSKNIFKGANRDVPFNKPFGYKSQIAASLVGLGPITTIGNLAAKQNYKGRQKFATKEGLARDFYRTTNTALQPNSPIGKDYLKDAGFGKSKAPVSTGEGDGNNKPILPLPIETTKSVDMDLIKPKENFFNFVAYKVGGLSGGVRYGPPPKRGPNPNVPPVKMKKGGYKKVMWFSAIKLAVQAGSHIYKNKQKTKMLMADAQMNHAQKMADGQAEYQGKLLESRNSDWKDEFILLLLSAPIVMLSWAVFSDDPSAMEKMKLFFEYFSQLPFWYQTIFVGVIASVYGLKATDLIKRK